MGAEFSNINFSKAKTRSLIREMTTQSFVAAVEAHGLMHLAVENSSALGSVMGDMNALKKTWQESKPFIIGTFEALLRDLDEDSDLLVYKESGDKSLQG